MWFTDELGNKDLNRLRVTSDFLEQQENDFLKKLLTTGVTKHDAKDNFSRNYNFFRSAIKDCGLSANDFALFSARILNNCYVVQKETCTQDEELQVFTSVNDRGLPLNTTDIFRSVLYKKVRKDEVKKQQFIEDLDKLLKISKKIFPQSTKITSMENLLMCYTKAFNESRAVSQIKKFFEKNNYERLLANKFIPDLFDLTGF